MTGVQGGALNRNPRQPLRLEACPAARGGRGDARKRDARPTPPLRQRAPRSGRAIKAVSGTWRYRRRFHRSDVHPPDASTTAHPSRGRQPFACYIITTSESTKRRSALICANVAIEGVDHELCRMADVNPELASCSSVSGRCRGRRRGGGKGSASGPWRSASRRTARATSAAEGGPGVGYVVGPPQYCTRNSRNRSSAGRVLLGVQRTEHRVGRDPAKRATMWWMVS